MAIEQGTEIARYYDGKIQAIVKVERVTATQVILPKGVKLRHNLSEIGAGGFHQVTYEIVTPEIREEFRLAKSRQVVLKQVEELANAVKNGDLEFITKVYESLKDLK